MYVLLHLFLSLFFDTHSWSSNPLWEAFASYAFNRVATFLKTDSFPINQIFAIMFLIIENFSKSIFLIIFSYKGDKKFVLTFSWYHWACHANNIDSVWKSLKFKPWLFPV